MDIGRQNIILNDDAEFNQAKGAWSVSFTNKGTATVYINDYTELAQNESFVYPIVSENHFYNDGYKIRFGDTGTKKLIINYIFPKK